MEKIINKLKNELINLVKNNKWEKLDDFRNKCWKKYRIFLPYLKLNKVMKSIRNEYYNINILSYIPEGFIEEEYKDLIIEFTKAQLYIYSDYTN